MYSGGESSLTEFELCELSGMRMLRDSFRRKSVPANCSTLAYGEAEHIRQHSLCDTLRTLPKGNRFRAGGILSPYPAGLRVVPGTIIQIACQQLDYAFYSRFFSGLRHRGRIVDRLRTTAEPESDATASGSAEY